MNTDGTLIWTSAIPLVVIIVVSSRAYHALKTFALFSVVLSLYYSCLEYVQVVGNEGLLPNLKRFPVIQAISPTPSPLYKEAIQFYPYENTETLG